MRAVRGLFKGLAHGKSALKRLLCRVSTVPGMPMTRLSVFKLRLAASAVLLLLALAVVRLLWFPGPYFAISGVGKLVAIMAVVALIVGPGLTTLVYKPGKKGLVLDIYLLAAVEIAAVAVALVMLHARQPYFTVLAVDRFEAVPLSEIDPTEILYEELRRRPGHQPRLVYAEMPTDPEIVSQLIDETVFQGKNDIDRRPEFWKPYPAGVRHLRQAARPLSDLIVEDSRRGRKAQRWLSRRDGSARDYLFLPLRGMEADAAMILHADIGYPVGALAVDPW